MGLEIRLARSEDDRLGAYRLRYDVYVEEMGRYGAVADHDNRRLVEPEDRTARIFVAVDDGEVVGTSRLNWGGDAAFTERHVEQYRLAPFLERLDPSALAVGERFMVKPELRGTDLLWSFMETGFRLFNEHRIQLSFGDCEPHLLGLYQKMGFRTYSSTNVNSPEAGFLVPLVFVIEDHAHLRRIGSPLVDVLLDYDAEARVPDGLDELLDDDGVVIEELSDDGEYWGRVHDTLRKVDPSQYSLFDDLGDEERRWCLEKSSIIETRAGDRILKTGNTARNMFVILEGVVELHLRNDRPVYLTVGDIFGEMGFLTGTPREMDVVAFTDGRILCLSESAVRNLIANHPATGAKVLFNLSRMLCAKVLRTGRT